jgi:hypothetical protein
MVWAGTNTALVNPSGNTTVYTAAWTASAVRTSSPTRAITHDQAYPNSSATPIPASRPSGLVRQRKPSRNPTAVISSRVRVARHRSDRVRPASTAIRAVGRDLNRSMLPRARSSARPAAVAAPENSANWASSPGTSQLTYFPPAAGGSAAWTAPPNTAVNIRMNTTGITLESSSTPGIRTVCSRFRRVSTATSRTPRRNPGRTSRTAAVTTHPPGVR